MQALESAEQLVGISHVESRAVVPDKIHRRLVGNGFPADHDLRAGLFRTELPGVADQVLKNLPDQRDVRAGQHAGLDGHLNLAPGLGLRQLCDDPGCLGTEVHSLPVQAGARQLGKQQQPVCEFAHAPHTATYPAQVMVRAFVGLRRHRLLQQGTVAVDGTQRGTQVVRHGIGESLQLRVGRLQLGGPARDPVFQVDVEPDNFHLGALALADVGDGADKPGRGVAGIVEQRPHIDQCPQITAIGLAVTDHHVRLRQARAPGHRAGPLILGHQGTVFAQRLPCRPE